MNKDKLYELILDYLDDNLDSSQLGLLKSELRNMGYDIHDLSSLQKLVNEMDAMPVPEPGPQMSDGFYKMLETESNKQEESELIDRILHFFRSIFQPTHFPRFAYATLILLLGWVIGYWFTPNARLENQMSKMNTEMQNMREMVMISMMEKPLASERLKALQMFKSSDQASKEIIHTLLNTLNKDPDANVRMAAVEALLAFANQDEVKAGLKQSVLYQDSPLVQLSLVDGLIAMNDKEAVPVLKNLVNAANVHQVVKERSKKGIKHLN